MKSESEVAQLCPTLGDPMDCSLLGFSVHGIFQARVLEWVVISVQGKTRILFFFFLEKLVTCAAYALHKEFWGDF